MMTVHFVLVYIFNFLTYNTVGCLLNRGKPTITENKPRPMSTGYKK